MQPLPGTVRPAALRRRELEDAIARLDEVQARTTERVDLLNTLASEIRHDDPRRTMELARLAQAAATGSGYTRGQAEALRHQGIAAYYLDRYDEALERSFEALPLFARLGEPIGEASCHHTIGLTYRALGEYAKALDYYMRALAVRQQVGDREGEAATLNSIGLLHHYLGDHHSALECHEKSLAMREAIGDLQGISHSLNNLGGAQSELGHHERARNFYLRALESTRSNQDRRTESITLNNLGESYFVAGEYARAREQLEASLSLKREQGNAKGQVETLILLGKVLTACDEMEGAEERLREALTVAREIKAQPEVSRAHGALAVLFERTGRLAEALTHLTESHRVEREVFDRENEAQTRLLRIGFEVEQSRRDADLYKKQATALSSANGALAEALAEAERQRAKAEEADQMRTELLSIAVHDLKNPIQSILGMAELIWVEHTEEPTGEHARIVLQSSRRMLRSIDEFLQMAQAESGRLDLTMELFDFGDVVRSAVRANEPQARNKEQTLLVEVSGVCRVEGDADRLRDVVDNLLSNAIKYSPAGKRIWVVVARGAARGAASSEASDGAHHNAPHATSRESRRDVVRLTVRDEGPGLRDDDRARIFGKFQRLSARPTAGEASSGLGLAIVKQLVELQGGTVAAKSDGPGTGTTFIVELPASE